MCREESDASHRTPTLSPTHTPYDRSTYTTRVTRGRDAGVGVGSVPRGGPDTLSPIHTDPGNLYMNSRGVYASEREGRSRSGVPVPIGRCRCRLVVDVVHRRVRVPGPRSFVRLFGHCMTTVSRDPTHAGERDSKNHRGGGRSRRIRRSPGSRYEANGQVIAIMLSLRCIFPGSVRVFDAVDLLHISTN